MAARYRIHSAVSIAVRSVTFADWGAVAVKCLRRRLSATGLSWLESVVLMRRRPHVLAIPTSFIRRAIRLKDLWTFCRKAAESVAQDDHKDPKILNCLPGSKFPSKPNDQLPELLGVRSAPTRRG
jgi:hypothetical protein